MARPSFLRTYREQIQFGLILRFVRTASWPVGDQALISATNFFGVIVVTRALSLEDLGVFSLAYAAMWAVNTIQGSLITQPFGVLAARRDVTEYRRYTSATGLMQVALMLVIGVPVMVVGALLPDPGAGSILIVVGFTIIAWQSQEFLRRILYVEGRMPEVVGIDIISYGGQFAVIVGLSVTGQLTVVSALAAAGVTSLVSAVVGLVLVRHTLFHWPLRAALAQNLAQGKWLLGADLGAFICLNSYPFVLGASHGTQAAAIYYGTQLFLNPLNVIWFASTTVVPIRLSRTRVDHGEVAARGELRTFYRLTAPLIGAYCLFIAIFGEPIMGLVYGNKFAGYGWVIALAAAFRFFLYHGHLISLGLRALEMARPIFIGLAAAVPFALVIGTALTVSIGILGAMISMFGATAIWTAIWARAYFSSAPTPRGSLATT